MSMVFACGNCEMSPCKCEIQDKVSSTVLSSNELVECDKNGKLKEKEFVMSRDVNYFGVNYKFAAVDPEAKVLLEELNDFGVSLPAINK